jgi:DEAD/DEAH box helicase domain-containing protein
MMEALPYNSTERLDGVNGLANALGAIATLLVMCDARDLGTSVGENAELEVIPDAAPDVAPGFSPAPLTTSPPSSAPGATLKGGATAETPERLSSSPGKRTVVRKIFEPNIYLYDSYPGGVGLSEPLFRLSDSLLEKTHKLISECPCPTGCPSCVGPAGEIGQKGKEVALELLRQMLAAT